MTSSRSALRALSALFYLALASCFEAPIREELRLRFLPNGAVVATSTVRVADPRDGNPALERRLAEARRELVEGTDSWGARFGAAAPSAERSFWEKQLGTLRSASRSALIIEPDGLEAFFRDTSLAVTYSVDAERGVADLSIVPGASTRATRRQRAEMKKTLDAWTADVAEYLQAGKDLYAYLDDRPDRARSCFGSLFAERLNEKDAATLSPLSAEEKRKLDRLDSAMERVLAVLAVPEGAAYSPDEVSRLIYDPFPARLTLKLPGDPLSLEGFLPGADGALTAASLGLWDSLRGLEGRWLAPDPVFFYVESAQAEGADVDLDTFLAKPRRSQPPSSAGEVRAAIEARLKPAPLYRVSWKIRPEDETPFRWEEGEAP
jgi:hypothetical protein